MLSQERPDGLAEIMPWSGPDFMKIEHGNPEYYLQFSLDTTVAFLRKTLLPCWWLAWEGLRAFCQLRATVPRIEAMLSGPVWPSAGSGFSLVS